MSIDLDLTCGLVDDEDNYLDRLDRVYRTRPEQMMNTANEQDFEAELAELRANLREMRLVLAEIGKAMGPWPGHPDTF